MEGYCLLARHPSAVHGEGMRLPSQYLYRQSGGNYKGREDERKAPLKQNIDFEYIKQTVQAEFEAFRLNDRGFTGGRFQTSIDHVFGHVDANGSLTKIEINKPGGTVFWLIELSRVAS